jgi:hypothetical protein
LPAIGAGEGMKQAEVFMKARTFIAAVAAAALLGGGGAALALPAAANADSVNHTIKFISVKKSTVTFGKANSGQADTDVNSKGKTVGFDMLNFQVNSKGNGQIQVTVDASEGFLIGFLPVSKGKVQPGLITGGIGIYKGAFGSITTKSLNASGTRTAVTITYHT